MEETGHLDDRVRNLFLPKTAGVDPDAAAADGFGVNRTTSYRAFPEWELVYCGDGATRARLEAAIAAINQSDGANLCCPRLCPNACCVQPCQSPPPWIADVFEDHEARLGAAEGDALDVWRAPLFSVWLWPPAAFAAGAFFAVVDSLMKPNAVVKHVLWGTASAACGEDNTLATFVTVACIFAVVGPAVALFVLRGKRTATIRVSDTHVSLSTRRSRTTTRWADVTEARLVPPRGELSLYSPGSLVVKTKSFERVEVSDACRDGCCGCCGFCTCFYAGLGCGVGYLNADVRVAECAQSDETLIEIPRAAERAATLAAVPGLSVLLAKSRAGRASVAADNKV